MNFQIPRHLKGIKPHNFFSCMINQQGSPRSVSLKTFSTTHSLLVWNVASYKILHNNKSLFEQNSTGLKTNYVTHLNFIFPCIISSSRNYAKGKDKGGKGKFNRLYATLTQVPKCPDIGNKYFIGLIFLPIVTVITKCYIIFLYILSSTIYVYTHTHTHSIIFLSRFNKYYT